MDESNLSFHFGSVSQENLQESEDDLDVQNGPVLEELIGNEELRDYEQNEENFHLKTEVCKYAIMWEFFVSVILCIFF